jgi:EpsI family protein
MTVVVLLVLSGAFSLFYKVERAARQQTADLTAMPKDIGAWRMAGEETNIGKRESEFLNDVLLRSYQRSDGKQITLAIAYGADQRQNFSIHVPEGCFRAAGFDVTSLGTARLEPLGLPLKQLLVKGKIESEPMQYWIVLDGKIVTNHFERKIKQVYYSLLGARAGGILIRVSTLSNDRDFRNDYDVQQAFIRELYRSLNPELRRLLFGDKIS